MLLISSLTSVLALGHTFFNKREAYSQAEMKAGLWMREEVPHDAVMVTLPTVHTPVTQIAGRVRVLSYTLWPYTHGFHLGQDSVFSRVEAIEAGYGAMDDPEVIRGLLTWYGARYIYIGEDELREFPEAVTMAQANSQLEKVYGADGVYLFRLVD